ncbi:ribosomal-processing cysteine protease Prp [uncultured Faecalibaculum sp.]|uniref:ribosomal-processing cysteine protease Prp n=1 Tax=uncultured Faecalibaculum sp. TaxID=1729681 RepID=UPI00345CC5C7
MIQVKILRLQGLNEIHLEASGHAGYAEPGRDIVCSAFSMLWQNLAGSVRNLTKARVKDSLTNTGTHVLEFTPITDKRMLLLLESFRQGVQSLQDAYPDCVQLAEY